MGRGYFITSIFYRAGPVRNNLAWPGNELQQVGVHNQASFSKMIEGPALEYSLRHSAVSGVAAVLHHPDDDESLRGVISMFVACALAMPEPIGGDREPKAVAFFHRRRRLPLGEFAKRGIAQVAPAVQTRTPLSSMRQKSAVCRGAVEKSRPRASESGAFGRQADR